MKSYLIGVLLLLCFFSTGKAGQKKADIQPLETWVVLSIMKQKDEFGMFRKNQAKQEIRGTLRVCADKIPTKQGALESKVPVVTGVVEESGSKEVIATGQKNSPTVISGKETDSQKPKAAVIPEPIMMISGNASVFPSGKLLSKPSLYIQDYQDSKVLCEYTQGYNPGGKVELQHGEVISWDKGDGEVIHFERVCADGFFYKSGGEEGYLRYGTLCKLGTRRVGTCTIIRWDLVHVRKGTIVDLLNRK